MPDEYKSFDDMRREREEADRRNDPCGRGHSYVQVREYTKVKREEEIGRTTDSDADRGYYPTHTVARKYLVKEYVCSVCNAEDTWEVPQSD